MTHWLGLLLTALCIVQDFTHSLRLREVRIPKYALKDKNAQLECLHDLEGEILYSVKWYKDGNEFYRYLPREIPSKHTYKLPGVTIDLENSNENVVSLVNLSLSSAGRYRCEVSGEAPAFQTVTEQNDMVVVLLPEDQTPKIFGAQSRYQPGDLLNANCTSGQAKPPLKLEWFINDEHAKPYMLRNYESTSNRDGLETSMLGLEFRVEPYHFRNGDMRLKCTASITDIYWRSNEESISGDRPQKAPMLESRETTHAASSNSRSDHVQGPSLREAFATKILSFFVEPNAASRRHLVVITHTSSILLMLITAAIASGCL